MVEKRVICDRCKKVIIDHHSILTLEFNAPSDTRDAMDICFDCTSLLLGWMAAGNPAAELEINGQ
ncbi:hypothetical protein [Singulisphaera acidiphila]|uniref:Uncharacterized protein n=1 Tax=Singulisphaera acidiphila (strain ATCC BAA-1392 / DSM 18658 / VKM B-2454 / MOB10) TaxID=886293 RepID=L0DH89_SINAD|nr:hypothetical protein [Singulisphaera acidiphila]AGA28739.1 hypothetical protein Sinac_4558 [Singulisphaera acidiphila DSM 18658]